MATTASYAVDSDHFIAPLPKTERLTGLGYVIWAAVLFWQKVRIPVAWNETHMGGCALAMKTISHLPIKTVLMLRILRLCAAAAAWIAISGASVIGHCRAPVFFGIGDGVREGRTKPLST